MIPVQKHMRSSAGFTLVELAIVMIIIGLLIAGVLKGQALITNAQVTSTVAQTKAIEAATTTFRDTYNMLPGDMTTPNTKLPNCAAAPCLTPGNGNATLDNLPSVAANVAANEGHQFFVHLNAASLLTGIVPGVGVASDVWGGNFPAAKITGNGFFAGATTGVAALVSQIGAVLPSGGLYLTITADATAAAGGATTLGLKPDQAFRIDTKLDDGSPDSGEVRGIGVATCGVAGVAGAGGTYTTTTTNNVCALYIHFQT
jgi:prepilin-type N-terminal cleavage/methylation domain-containing protein